VPPLPVTAERDADGLFVLVTGLRERAQCLGQFFLERGVFQQQFADFLEFDRLDHPAGEKVDDMAGHRGFLDDDGLFFDAEDRSGELAPAVRHGDFGAAKLVKELRERRVSGDIHLETSKGFFNRVERRIGDGGDFPAVEVLEDERLEDVVDLCGLEADFG